jgi:ParB family transcriptional regulator, chromosome partitioning protein
VSDQESRLRRPALGRGLAALIPEAAPPTRSGVMQLAIERIAPDPQQPRHQFKRESLAELAVSIRAQGVLQPILVRKSGEGYIIVAGERRWRAAQQAGLHDVPVLVREIAESAAFEIALVENLQREDLTALEEAEAYRRLIDEHGLTQDELAKRVGRDRSTIANALRLLRLPDEVKAAISSGALSMGHARALLALEDPARMTQLSRQVIALGLSVRAVEQLARGRRARRKGVAPASNPNARALCESLMRALGTKVTLHGPGNTGTLQIHYSSLDELDRIVEKILTE